MERLTFIKKNGKFADSDCPNYLFQNVGIVSSQKQAEKSVFNAICFEKKLVKYLFGFLSITEKEKKNPQK